MIRHKDPLKHRLNFLLTVVEMTYFKGARRMRGFFSSSDKKTRSSTVSTTSLVLGSILSERKSGLEKSVTVYLVSLVRVETEIF